jgi:hypothetical protein
MPSSKVMRNVGRRYLSGSTGYCCAIRFSSCLYLSAMPSKMYVKRPPITCESSQDSKHESHERLHSISAGVHIKGLACALTSSTS